MDSTQLLIEHTKIDIAYKQLWSSVALTVLFGLLMAYIAWHQWQLTRDKLQLDLFEKRFRMFNLIKGFVKKVNSPNGVTETDIHDFFNDSQESQFFLKGIYGWVNQIHKNAWELFCLKTDSVIQKDSSAREQELVRWFLFILRDGPDNIWNKFSTYLTFDDKI